MPTINKEEIKLPKDILQALEEIPDKPTRKYDQTPEAEYILSKYGKRKAAEGLKDIISKVTGRPISTATIHRKIREMKL